MNSESPQAIFQARLLRVHAFWLTAGDGPLQDFERVIGNSAKLLGLTKDQFWQPFSGMEAHEERDRVDWLDRMFCSRPAEWKPEDSETIIRNSCDSIPHVDPIDPAPRARMRF